MKFRILLGNLKVKFTGRAKKIVLLRFLVKNFQKIFFENHLQECIFMLFLKKFSLSRRYD
jgi:hypothetical protein